VNNNEHIPHDNPYLEDEHFAEVFALAFIREGTCPTPELCQRWLKEGFVNEQELEDMLEAYESYIWDGR